MIINIVKLYNLLSNSKEISDKVGDRYNDLLSLKRNLKDIITEEKDSEFKFLYINCGVGNNLIFLKDIFRNSFILGLESSEKFIDVMNEQSQKDGVLDEMCVEVYRYSYNIELKQKFDYVYIDYTSECLLKEDFKVAIKFVKDSGTILIDKWVYDLNKELIEFMIKEEKKEYHIINIHNKIVINFFNPKVDLDLTYLDFNENKSMQNSNNIDDEKIAFIACVNDEKKFDLACNYIKRLELQNNIKIEVVGVKNALSITSGYNMAMKYTNAKYKIYLHQDVWILNKRFLNNLIHIFKNNDNLGLMGVSGATYVPINGIWWEGICYGKVFDSHTGTMQLLNFENFNGEYKKVQALDGLILMTSHDILWRSDIFDGWHFYDLSQCKEFYRNNYEVGVVNQFNPWFMHECGQVSLNGYEKYKEVFINEYFKKNIGNYKKDDFPLVSILIPAYNEVNYFKQAIDSALNQTYKNIEIIVCDDSTTDDIKNLMKEYTGMYKNIIYINNNGPLGLKGALNLQKCFDLCNGEYINFLMQDDLFEKNKIEIMVKYLKENKDATLATSYRKIIDGNGNVMPDISVTKPFVNKTSIIDGKNIASYILTNMLNIIGEFTTAMFRKKDIDDKLLNYFGYTLRCNGDVAVWLKLMKKGDVIYIREPLSYFRIHDRQNSFDSALRVWGELEWYYLIENSYKTKHFLNRESFIKALKIWSNNNISKVYESDKIFEKAKDDAELMEAKMRVYHCYENALKHFMEIKD